jgi:hypothetical protein
MEISRPTDAIQHPLMELFKRLRSEGIQITKELNQQLREQYGETISAADLDAVIQQYGDHPAQAPARGLSLVVNK